MRENDRKKARTLTRAFPVLKHARCGRAAMMSIGDVKCDHPSEGAFDEADVSRLGEHPRGVPHSIRCRKINGRFAAGFSREQIVQFTHCPIDQENRSGLRMQRLYMTNSIILLIDPCQLMFLDRPLQVLFATGGRRN